MTAFILIHGSWHGAWCWHRVVPRLRSHGHWVDAIDLPGHGRDRTPPDAITLDSYVDAISAAIARVPDSEPVVLVAHSRGGIPASQAAERHPDRVAHVVYLAAYLLADGETVLDHVIHDTESLVLPALSFDPGGHWDMLNADAYEAALYADCSSDDLALASALLTPEPSLPSRTPVSLTPERYGTVARSYIELLDDRAVSLSLQRRMHGALPCAVSSIAAGHSAYFSAPDALVDRILEAAGAERR